MVISTVHVLSALTPVKVKTSMLPTEEDVEADSDPRIKCGQAVCVKGG
jgi:hypothetical protein